MSDFLFLIDGSGLLSTQYYGNLPREILYAKTPEEKEKYYDKIMMTSKGVYTNAVFGFMRTLFKILREQKPSHLAVAWDLSRNTFRREMYADYKQNRTEVPVPLRDQFDLCQKVLKEIGVAQFMDERYEADDFCGTLAHRFEQSIPVKILTKDNDYLQLVTEKTSVWMMHSTAEKTEELLKKYRIDPQKAELPDRVFPFSPELVEREIGVPPSSVNSLKGLMGDSSDNIKGVPGIGKETAVKLIAEYGTVDALYQKLENLDKASEKKLKDYWKNTLGIKRSPLSYLLKESEEELVGKKAAYLSEQLATICREAPVDCTLEDLRTKIDTDAAAEAFRRLEFHSIRADLGEKKEKKDPWNKASLRMTEDLNEALEWIRELGKKKKLGISVFLSQKEVLAAAVYDGELCYFFHTVFFITPEMISGWMKEFLEKKIQIYVPDAKEYYHAAGAKEKGNLHDAGIAAYLLDPLKADYPIEETANLVLEWKISSYKDLFGKAEPGEAVAEENFPYFLACQAVASLLAGEKLEKKLDETGMRTLFSDMEMPLAFDLYCMEEAGILVKREALKSYGENLSGEISSLETEICDLAGQPFNILSPKQLGEILFERMKLPGAKKTKSGYSTSADVLEKLAPDYPIAEKILRYRQLTKLKSTYAEGLAACIASDGRIHGTFNQTITATGRISSTEPNLQNIPVRMELGREIRRVFVPKEGCLFLDADYSQIELRILAHMSEDQNLIEAYRDAKDIHAMTASQVFHIPLAEVTPLQRRNAKAVNFGIVYGISAFGLSEGLSISRQEAMEYIERYFETYPGVKRYLDRMVEEGREKEYVTTLYGRRRPIPELKSSNYMQRQFGERVAMNSPIQGTAADIMKIAMIRVNRRLRKEGLKTQIVLQIHDELLLETPFEEKERAGQILKEEMQHAADLSVALEVSLSEGSDWYEAK